MLDDATVSRHLTIRGRVQGVYYRASAQAEGVRLGLAGWVRNRRDGSVEALVAGPETAVEHFITWARRGPPAAHVQELVVAEGPLPEPGPFSVRPTA
ncbi:acylphosphatase [Aromatoleum anaerobium]|uniref:acylphosphatase n=1 Tax=Aromatoleum anaerobium TaxID=182180 RepID=A0ABX1PMZ8_9RHOO|nr:acylphosphatase [Aromatoleum anaerobium]MCK0505513.1 acylphosphatase [Aromatoleum anaerobium]